MRFSRSSNGVIVQSRVQRCVFIMASVDTTFYEYTYVDCLLPKESVYMLHLYVTIYDNDDNY